METDHGKYRLQPPMLLEKTKEYDSSTVAPITVEG